MECALAVFQYIECLSCSLRIHQVFVAIIEFVQFFSIIFYIKSCFFYFFLQCSSLLFAFVIMFDSSVFGFLPKCASNGGSLVET